MKNVLTGLAALLLSAFGFSDQALKGLYKFEIVMGNIAVDTSGNDNHATLVNSPQRVDADSCS